MRIRRGFVSNSSTTSFCVYGTTVPEENDVWSEARKIGLEVDYYNEYTDGDRQVVGISYSEIRDDETGAEFKARVEALVRQILPDATDFGHHEDAYRDG